MTKVTTCDPFPESVLKRMRCKLLHKKISVIDKDLKIHHLCPKCDVKIKANKL